MAVNYTTPIDAAETESLKSVVNTNLIGLMLCTRVAIKIMKDNNKAGSTININSRSGHYARAISFISIYTVTKYGVTGFVEYLWKELDVLGSKIKITLRIIHTITRLRYSYAF